MGTNKTNHVEKNRRFKYDVALSFAEEDRPFVDTVAQHLKNKGLHIFYDKDALIDSWGKDLYVHLDTVYREKARFCVLFISRHYKQKRWAQHERIRAQARSFQENREYILPFKFDDTEIEGVRDEVVYLTKEEYNEKDLSDAIFVKIENSKSGRRNIPEAVKRFFPVKAWLFGFLATTISLGMYALSGQLPEVNSLKKRQKRENQKIYKGAVCMDSTISSSQGPGTCSHHGGVARYLDSIEYYKALEQNSQ